MTNREFSEKLEEFVQVSVERRPSYVGITGYLMSIVEMMYNDLDEDIRQHYANIFTNEVERMRSESERTKDLDSLDTVDILR